MFRLALRFGLFPEQEQLLRLSTDYRGEFLKWVKQLQELNCVNIANGKKGLLVQMETRQRQKCFSLKMVYSNEVMYDEI